MTSFLIPFNINSFNFLTNFISQMNTLKNNLKNALIVLIISFTINANAQLSISIPLGSELPSKNIEVLSVDFMTEEISKWGSLDESGDITFSLSYDYMDELLKKAEKQQKDAPKGWTLKFKTAGSEHTCNKYGESTIEIENPDIRLFGVPSFFAGVESEKKRYGDMYAASNEAVATWLHGYQMGSASTGFYLEWIYAEGDATVIGSCTTNTGTGYNDEEFDAVTNYNLQFKEGWNTVVHQIDEVFDSASGTFYLKTKTVYTAKFYDDLYWYVLD